VSAIATYGRDFQGMSRSRIHAGAGTETSLRSEASTGRGCDMKVGFIGLGSLGGPIARRLQRCGFEVVACEVVPAVLAAFDEPGSNREASPLATAQQVKLLGVCVRTDDQVTSLFGDGSLFKALGQGGLVIMHSNVAPELVRKLDVQAKQYGVDVIDAGVSGGAPAVAEGKLSLFVGGDATAVEKAKPWFDAIAKHVAYLGPIGRGMEGKLINNLISVANYGMSAAILDVGMKLGFDREQLQQALMAGSAQSFALQAAPSFMGLRPGATRESLEAIHDLLKKDVDHARNLPPSDDAAMAALLAASDAMLKRVKRAAAEKG
jgi:3-hydroxyisobutyrate dehydrogenase